MYVPNFVQALFSASRVAATISIPGSSFAGSPSTAVFPPPNATITQYSSFFPAASEVGFGGATPTGDEPEALATASAAEKDDVYPLTRPPTLSDENPGDHSSFNPMRSWGSLSPWFSVQSAENGLPGASPRVPKGCSLKQVHLLHRHGARYPTAGDGPARFANALHEVAGTTGFKVSGPLKFLSTWTYKLGADSLLPFGRQQLFENGVSFRIRYGKLLDGFKNIPVFRTVSIARMVDTAVAFAAGFFGIQEYQDQLHLSIAVEEPYYKTALAPFLSCPNVLRNAHESTNALAQWGPVYLNKAIDRLQEYISGLTLNYTHVYAMQQLCAYETVALGYSKFCGLFTEEEWRGFEYSSDLTFWYLGGPGDPTATAQGVGYVQELIARLTRTPLTTFDTSVNETLSGNNITFPLDQPIYADFTHDLTIASVLMAMNITTGSFAKQGPLPVTHIPTDLTYRVQHMVPFAANLVGQVLSCPASGENPSPLHYIRWLLNDGVVPLTGIKQCADYHNRNGLCPLESFVAGMRELVEDTNWNFDCFGNWTVPGVPNDIVNGKPRGSTAPTRLV